MKYPSVFLYPSKCPLSFHHTQKGTPNPPKICSHEKLSSTKVWKHRRTQKIAAHEVFSVSPTTNNRQRFGSVREGPNRTVYNL